MGCGLTYKSVQKAWGKNCITTFVESPLRGPNIEEQGERFPDMSNLCDKDLRDIALKVAKENKITLHEGVFV